MAASRPSDKPDHDGKGDSDVETSVLMPVYNAESTLGASLASAFSQTQPPDEIIAIDDGSVDGTAAILAACERPGLKVFSQANQGLAATLNRGLGLARGRYIARLDNDDLALPDRLERQVQFMERHPEVAVLGAWAEIYEGNTPSGRHHRHPTENARLRLDLLFDNPFVHSSIMMRTDVIRELGGYRVEGNRFPEDYDLWSRVAERHQVANLPEVLAIYREMPGSMTRTGGREILRNVVRISTRNLCKALPDATEQECAGLSALYHGIREMPAPSLLRILRLWRNAAITIGGAPSSWSTQFREGYVKTKRHLVSQYFRRIMPAGLENGLRTLKRGLVNRS